MITDLICCVENGQMLFGEVFSVSSKQCRETDRDHCK